jgi:hypothetical protein
MLTPITSTDYGYHKQETKRYPCYRKQKSGSNRSNKSATWYEKEETEQNRLAEKKRDSVERSCGGKARRIRRQLKGCYHLKARIIHPQLEPKRC